MANVLPINPQNLHYTAFLVIDEKSNSDKLMLGQNGVHRDNPIECGER